MLDRSESAGYMTNWAARLFARAIDRELRPVGTSSGQLPVFFALDGGRSSKQGALARMAAVEQATMAATLSRMERDGLLARRPDPADRRSALVSLTPRGAAKVEAIRAAVARVNAAALAGVSPADRATYLALLRTIIGALAPEEPAA